jgi:hypothetical protein
LTEMTLDMVLNDLSLTPAADVFIARSRMSGMVQTIKQASLYKIKGALRTQAGLKDVMLADGYPLYLWSCDRDVNPDERLFLLRLATKAPYWQDHATLEDRVRATEYWFGDQTAQGLGVAHILDTLAVSLASDPVWNAPQLTLLCERLSDDIEIWRTEEEIRHASTPDHVTLNAPWVQERLRRDIKIGHELWDRREELLPSLQFCDSVKPQLEGLISEMLPAVARHLFALDSYCSNWRAGGFNPKEIPLKISVESAPTLAQYGSERTFTCPDGINRLFNWHSKVGPGAFRIHFVPLGPGELIIGYIGHHLRIVSAK